MLSIIDLILYVNLSVIKCRHLCIDRIHLSGLRQQYTYFTQLISIESASYLALVVRTGLGGGGGSTSDSAPDSELLSFSPFLFLFFFLLLCFLCFLFFLWGGSFSSLAFMSSFSGASSSPVPGSQYFRLDKYLTNPLYVQNLEQVISGVDQVMGGWRESKLQFTVHCSRKCLNHSMYTKSDVWLSEIWPILVSLSS